MLYQLPNGRVINLSLEEYLNMSDNDIQDLNGSNVGDYPTSIWYQSTVKNTEKVKKAVEISLDYDQDSDEVTGPITISINSLTVDEIEKLGDNEESLEDN
jgi:hypothetical protein